MGYEIDITKEILQKLMYNSKLHYNEIWNKKVPSSKFNYYIKQLISKGLIEKDKDKRYMLTDIGNQYIAELNTKKLVKQTIPITCSFVLCIKQEGESTYVLLQQRKKQPYLGMLNIPGGKVEFGENTYDAGVRELFEESKLVVKDMKLKSIDEIITLYESENVFAHIIAYMYVCFDFSGELEVENEEGKMIWIDIEDINSLNDSKDIFPNLVEIIPKLVQTNEILIQETKRVKDENGNFISYSITPKK